MGKKKKRCKIHSMATICIFKRDVHTDTQERREENVQSISGKTHKKTGNRKQ